MDLFERKPLTEETVEVVSIERGGTAQTTKLEDGTIYTRVLRHDGTAAADTRYDDGIELIEGTPSYGGGPTVIGFRVTRRGDWWKRD